MAPNLASDAPIAAPVPPLTSAPRASWALHNHTEQPAAPLLSLTDAVPHRALCRTHVTPYRPFAVRLLCRTIRTAGPHLSRMLEEVLSETAGFDELSLADNRLSDDCVSHVVEGLRHNLNGLQIRCV